ncbi:oxireductase domain protein [Formosa agariphila KMM 3901]|uniref:Oxireductase domain protein n=1 Tax=Formosa agariphila (strain DSM 15362 / KCTC 12365 / LMG 23005 / KMM 3901 / M-2Alg 35-1) TaxID=1347342 RepID=T2KJQ9_FORAG|nr:Gfo/Idh/MocA family oxidoreductase [Formosa agariphila]CDF79005.1 oxireductase domain protein [Formosa agariphila KMM 3901]
MSLQQNKTIRWGIIGLGKIARKFATDLLTIEDAQLQAVASRSIENANAFAKTFKATKAYDSYEALAQDPDVDAIYIATPHSFHKSHAILCLKHGKAVLCEKPFAMNTEEVKEMISVAKANNVLLMEALWTYFLPHYQFALNYIKNETYGKLLKIEADFGFTRPFNESSRLFDKSVGGGSLLDIGIYPIFATLSTLGEPDDIEASCTLFKNGADSSCDMIFKYSNGTEALLKSTLIADTPTICKFTCEDATITLNTQFHAPTTVTIAKNGKEEILDYTGTTIGYNFETEHFNQLLRDGKIESNIMTYDFSLKLINTLDKIRERINLQY